MSECFLSGHGECHGKMSGEHYVSASVLRAVAPKGDLQIAGQAWQPSGSFQAIGIGSLQSKIMCRHHNSQLSNLDEEAGNFFKAVIAADQAPGSLMEETEFDGAKIERWMLKTLIATSVSGGIRGARVAEIHKEILMGAPWPEGWGLYGMATTEPTTFTPDLRFETSLNPETGELVAAVFWITGVKFWLLLLPPDDPLAFGVSRPRGLIFTLGQLVRTIHIRWPNGLRNAALTFTRVGPTDQAPPHILKLRQDISAQNNKRKT